MNELAMKIKQPKRRGEWVELRFMAAAAEHDLHATKPGETPRNTTSYSNTVATSSASRSSQRNSKKDSGAYPCAVHGSGQRAYPRRRLRLPRRVCCSRGRLVHHSRARLPRPSQCLPAPKPGKIEIRQIPRRVGFDEGRAYGFARLNQPDRGDLRLMAPRFTAPLLPPASPRQQYWQRVPERSHVVPADTPGCCMKARRSLRRLPRLELSAAGRSRCWGRRA
jgi:hypothetical protein